ncbi:MAG: hypothetical protein AAB353_05740 [Candidatus Hydrogenedentota bacterium]
MNRQGSQKRIHVLTREESLLWHSPFSGVLRDARQQRLIERAREMTRASGGHHFAIFDADEYALYHGSIDDVA